MDKAKDKLLKNNKNRHCEAPLGAVAISFPKYESYKDSGVEWIGYVPEGWEVLANRYIFILKKTMFL
jgi:hypothetical protein